MENSLFDIRTRIKPQYIGKSDIAIVTVGNEDIKKLQPKEHKTLKPDSLKKIIDATIKSNPKAIGILLPHQDFNYKDKNLLKIIAEYQSNKNVYFGDYDINSVSTPNSSQVSLLKKLPNNIYSADTFRPFRRSIIRELYIQSYRGTKKSSQLITQIALDHTKNKKQLEDWINERNSFKLNYFLPHTYINIEAGDLALSGSNNKLNNKIVLIGYTAFRKRAGIYKEGTYANTPWQDETNDISQSSAMPQLYIQASGLRNLLHNSWLKPSPHWINLFQTITLSLLCFLVWKATTASAIGMLVGILGILLFIHGLLFTFLSSITPLADTVIFSVLATIGGAFWRAQKDNVLRVQKESRLVSHEKISEIQDSFLNKFAKNLYEMNMEIKRILMKYKELGEDETQTIGRMYKKAYSSNMELEEYLDGIKQYANLEKGDLIHPKKSTIVLDKLIKRILKHFESRITENKVEIELISAMQLKCWSDIVYLEPILFNFISNAIKYSPEGAKVQIHVKDVGNDKVCVSVKDQGPGIDKELQERIFEKFYRIKNDDVYKIKGNGLGLFLSRFFASKIGAPITVISEIGNGAEFTIEMEKFK